MRCRRGWVFMDVVMAMILLSLVAAILSTAAGWHQRALRHLADSRAAVRAAESALISLQAGQIPPNDSTIFLHKLTASSDVPGKAWVEVDAKAGQRSASLIGLVPAGGGS
jgi:hypothetical protein